MKTIELTQGYKALVDDQDFDWLIGYTWRYTKNKTTDHAVTDRESETIYMHNLIMKHHGLWIDDHVVRHIDNNTLNNQRTNLKMISKEVMYNKRAVRSDNKIGYKGVTEYKGKWRAAITFNGKRTHIGTYDTPEEAARAYNRFSRNMFGEDCFQNQVDD